MHSETRPGMKNENAFITFSDRKKTCHIKHEDIYYIRSSGMCCVAYTSKGIYSRSANLAVIVKELKNSNMFFRIHTSYVINRHNIREYLKSDGGTILMADETKIAVAKRRRKDFLAWYKYSHSAFQ